MFQDGFPNELREDVTKVVSMIPERTYGEPGSSTSEENIEYYQEGIEVKFPYRMYHINISDEIINKLSLQQQIILHCIYSRSCDGFVREKHLHSLLLMDYADWAIPYIVKVCDEYVIEIIETTYAILKEQDTERIKKFCYENVQSFCKSYDRMTSYWNEYYRDRCYDFRQYIGRKLFRECFGYCRALERQSS